MGRRLPILSSDAGFDFPPLEAATPEGLLAVGGDLHPERLLAAYRRGIFPWYSADQPILWWSPDPRAVLLPTQLHVPRSLGKALRANRFRVTFDHCFRDVMLACAAPRAAGGGTWITSDMVEAYCTLHARGAAHSVEAWRGDELAGGLYGVALGGAFFGESMFTRIADASKVAFVRLVRQLAQWGFTLLDCQQYTAHLARFGAREIPRAEFVRRLDAALALPGRDGPWQFDAGCEDEA